VKWKGVSGGWALSSRAACPEAEPEFGAQGGSDEFQIPNSEFQNAHASALAGILPFQNAHANALPGIKLFQNAKANAAAVIGLPMCRKARFEVRLQNDCI
jgi:hypothetical protein